MALTNYSNGSQTVSSGAGHTLTGGAITAAGIYVLRLDLANLTGGSTPDTIEVKVTSKVRSSGSERTEIGPLSYVGGLIPQPIISLPPVLSLHSVSFVLTYKQGTARSVDWSIETI